MREGCHVERYLAPIKINLTLEVGPKRPDRYHEVATYLVKLAWGDTLLVAAANRTGEDPAAVRLTVRGRGVPRGPRNLAWQAASRWLVAHPDCGPVHLVLRKRVPAGTGLGGGSSDAGTLLRALQYGCARAAGAMATAGDALRDLLHMAQGLGADVPFFVLEAVGAQGWGRGEVLQEGPGLPVPWPVVLAFPPCRLATAAVYARAHPRSPVSDLGWRTRAVAALLSEAAKGHAGETGSTDAVTERVLAALAELVGSDLTGAAVSCCPELEGLAARMRGALPEHRPMGMTGSGSALFAVCATVEEAVRTAGRLRGSGLQVRVTRGLSPEARV